LVNVAVDVTSPKSICGCGLGDFSKGASPPVAASMPRPSTEKAHQLRIGYRAGDMWAPHLPAKEALQTEAEHFIDCLCRGATPISSGLTGLHVVEILEATSRSIAARGNPVEIEHKFGKRVL